MSPRVRFPSGLDLPPEPDPVAEIGPIVFTAVFKGEERRFDLSDLPCPRLVRRLAAVMAGQFGDGNSQQAETSAKATLRCVRDFVMFVGAAETEAAEDLDLTDLNPEMLEAFELMIRARAGEKSREPYAMMSSITRMLRLAGDASPGSFDMEMQSRLGFAALVTPGTKGFKPLDAYPFPVFDAIHTAALEDVRRIRDRILEGERQAVLGGNVEDPEAGGWSRPENVYRRVADHGPIEKADWWGKVPARSFYREGGIARFNHGLFLSPQDLASFVILLICQTGMEPECVKGLRADCLVNSARGFVSISYVKNRAHGDKHKTMRVPDGGALHFPGGLIRLALRLTRRSRDLLGGDGLWFDVTRAGAHRETFARSPKGFLPVGKRWLELHGLDGLIDRGGKPVHLHLGRLRKTVKSRRYLETAGVLDDFATGHTKGVAASHYADIEAHRGLHEDAVEDGQRELLNQALHPPVVLSEDGERLDDGSQDLPPEDVAAALSGERDVWLASCTDYYASPFALRKGAGCPVSIWGCLECPNAVFTTRHLPSVLSFLAFVEEQREEYSVAEWKVRYGLPHQRIVEGIRPKFTPEQIRTAHAIAEGGGERLRLPAEFLAAVS